MLFNLYFIFTFKKDRLEKKSIEETLIYKQKSNERYFCNLAQGFTVYKKGISARNKSLLIDYCLDTVDFNDHDLIVDVGANIGDLFFAVTQVNPFIKYIGFEPSLPEFKVTKLNTMHGDAEVHNVACGNFNGQGQLFLNSSNADNSLINFLGSKKVVPTKVKILDDFLLKNIKLLKVDAEGAEPEVLTGALNTIKNCEFVAVDVSFERGMNKDSTIIQVLQIMQNSGFFVNAVNLDRLCILFKKNLV